MPSSEYLYRVKIISPLHKIPVFVGPSLSCWLFSHVLSLPVSLTYEVGRSTSRMTFIISFHTTYPTITSARPYTDMLQTESNCNSYIFTDSIFIPHLAVAFAYLLFSSSLSSPSSLLTLSYYECLHNAWINEFQFPRVISPPWQIQGLCRLFLFYGGGYLSMSFCPIIISSKTS